MKTATLIALLLFCGLLAAAPIKVGSQLPAITLKDQQDTPQSITADTRYLIFVAERAPAAVAETALDGQTAATLAKAQIRYVADISAMPGVIATVIALPKMRKRPYPMLLARRSEATSMLPREPAKVTLIEAQGGYIKAVRFIADADTLGAALGFKQK